LPIFNLYLYKGQGECIKGQYKGQAKKNILCVQMDNSEEEKLHG